jgi:hypothetical protein
MIPKIIHYCWLSGDEYPSSIQKCLDTWKRYLCDYEIVLWNKSRFDVNDITWTRQAYEAKKYAFAADYIRLYALYNYGGIYLDSDVIVYKDFDSLLHLPYFIGEDRTHCFEAAIIGCQPGMPWIKEVLDHYEGRSFIKKDGSLDMQGLPNVFAERLFPNHRFQLIREIPQSYELADTDVMGIFRWNFFNSRDYVDPVRTRNSFCSHAYAGSWLNEPTKTKKLIKRLLPRPVANCYYSLRYNLFNRVNHNQSGISYI